MQRLHIHFTVHSITRKGCTSTLLSTLITRKGYTSTLLSTLLHAKVTHPLYCPLCYTQRLHIHFTVHSVTHKGYTSTLLSTLLHAKVTHPLYCPLCYTQRLALQNIVSRYTEFKLETSLFGNKNIDNVDSSTYVLVVHDYIKN